ncbi:LuxR C-terminal-related transcriptional regulator [Streptomyces sp. NBC_01077]|uniref:helix-turn-helix transcriptional regulator n=1 Tax=Streptomyces sp. NBC_01077 TaxID=2903746 RepID=UPI00386862F7|nr:LuxR C-terminal-related transcriptional regulator [Streptomyces sp. NBC_01077]WSV43646.1 LuxR C-terminal-related transcriptional regulator [Streptomyces sp. NBC_01077]
MNTQTRTAQWPLVGRETELKGFQQAWAARRAEGTVIFGVGGAGKSRLADEFLSWAKQDGWKIARVTASAAAAAIPLGAVAHLIPDGVDLSNPVKGFADVARVLSGTQRSRWAVLVDDLHLLDATSAVLLRQLLDVGVMRLIGTVRNGEPMSEAVQALCGGDAIYRVDLSELDREQVAVALRSALGGTVGKRTVHTLYTTSGGNMLYLRELVEGALSSGTLTNDGQIWELSEDQPLGTPRLTELIGAHLASADARARPVLEMLALCESMSLADAEALAPRGVLAETEAAGLTHTLQERRRTTISLAHPLYGEVLRSKIPSIRRRGLLLELVHRIESHGARRRDDQLHIASWRLTATGTADPMQLIQAAALASHSLDFQQAVTLLRAIPADQHIFMSLLLLGNSLFELGHASAADEALIGAHKLASNDSEKLSAVFARTTSLFWAKDRTAEAFAVNEEAAAELSGPSEQACLRVNEGFMRIFAGHPERGLTLLQDLGDDPLTFPSPNIWVMGAAVKPTALALIGRTSDAVREAEEAYARHSRISDQTLLRPVAQLIPLVLALAKAGRLDEAREIGGRARQELDEVHSPLVGIWLAFYQAHTEWLAGHPEDARHWFAEAAALSRACRNYRGLRPALAGLAATAAVLGRVDEAEAFVNEAASYPSMGFHNGEDRLGEAWLHVARGNLRKARTVLAEAAEEAKRNGHVASEALLLTDIARLGGAKDVAKRLAELTRTFDGALSAAYAHLATALAADDPDQCLAVAEELTAVGADLLAAEAASAAAAALRRVGKTRRATAAIQCAQAYASRCQGARTPLIAISEATLALTAREQEVARLAAHGTTSKDIAEALHLSVRTVDNHLHHAYTKLGVTTRRGLAQALGLKPSSGVALKPVR